MSTTPLRVFVSYSSEDFELVKQLVAILEENGMRPMWDKEFDVGVKFHERIKTYIAHAHVFMPVLTESSNSRGWVHQEIGYAVALNVPVMPLATPGVLPDQMLRELNAEMLDSGVDGIRPQLTRKQFEKLAEGYRDQQLALYSCADDPPQRAEMMAGYADDVRSMEAYGRVRQKGALSSFHIPKEVIANRVWRDRYGGLDRGDFHCTHQRNERLALEKHAKAEGCRIIIDPSIKYEHWGSYARKVRLQTLVKFLELMPDGKAQVAFNPEMQRARNLTLVGDWFAAESISGTIDLGYRQTIFTRHAPSVASRVDLFDDEFEELLGEAGWTAETSRTSAIEELNRLIEWIDLDAAERDA